MKIRNLFTVLSLLPLLLVPPPLSSGEVATHYVAMAALPTSIGSPTTVKGVSLATKSIVVKTLVLTNTGGSDYTVQVHDCQSTPAQLIKDNSTIAAGSTVTFNFGIGVYMGCFKWVANNAAVMGSVAGD